MTQSNTYTKWDNRRKEFIEYALKTGDKKLFNIMTTDTPQWYYYLTSRYRLVNNLIVDVIRNREE